MKNENNEIEQTADPYISHHCGEDSAAAAARVALFGLRL